jgi:hypothetical protein
MLPPNLRDQQAGHRPSLAQGLVHLSSPMRSARIETQW